MQADHGVKEGGGEGKWTKDEDRTLLEMIKAEKPWKDISDVSGQ